VVEEEFNQNTFMIVGLGNPGLRYRHYRHNVGFMVIDALAKQLDLKLKKAKSKALIVETRYEGKSLILVKPQTFMNLSGKSVAPLVRFFKVPLENLVIIHDDLDIPLGTIRIRPGGGTGGQQGVKSILNELGDRQVPRLRVGISRPPGRMDPADYVLQDFSSAEKDELEDVLERSSKALLMILNEGLEKAMTCFNANNGKDS